MQRAFERAKLAGSDKMTKLLHSVVMGSLLAVAGVPVGAAQAQSLGQTIFSKILGTDESEPAINYSERAPLVLPPKRDLVEPMAKVTPETDPAWPKDPDAMKRSKKASADKRGVAPGGNTELVSQEELAAGRLEGAPIDQRNTLAAIQEYNRMSNPVNPKQLRRRGSLTGSDEPLVAGVEPPRRSLIDPPTGLRTPLATAPLGGDEPLPSELSAEENKPWYQQVWKFGGGGD
jgi:hypothetical protein